LIIFGPIALIFVTPFGALVLSVEATKCFSRSSGCCYFFLLLLRIIIALLAFGLGAVANIIVVPAAILFGIPYLIFKEINGKR
jgi:hypothetical protein